MRLLNNSYSVILAKGRLPVSLDLGQDLLSFSPPDITLGIEIICEIPLSQHIHVILDRLNIRRAISVFA
jgi:hypothetical protein